MLIQDDDELHQPGPRVHNFTGPWRSSGVANTRPDILSLEKAEPTFDIREFLHYIDHLLSRFLSPVSVFILPCPSPP